MSIAEVQITKEEEYQKTPLSGVSNQSLMKLQSLVMSLLHHPPVFVCVQGEEELELCATELLYQGILPSLPQYMVRDACSKCSCHTLKELCSYQQACVCLCFRSLSSRSYWLLLPRLKPRRTPSTFWQMFYLKKCRKALTHTHMHG